MSTLNVQNITDGTTTVGTTNISKGIAKAYLLFLGSSPGNLTNSYNINSITDNGLGDFTVNFTNPLENNLFVVSMATEESTNLSFTLQDKNGNLGNRGTDQYRFQCIYHNPTTGVAANLDGGYHNIVFY